MRTWTDRTLLREPLSLWLYAGYGLFILGFFLFPERPEHYRFYYVAVMLPCLLLGRQVLPELWRDTVFRLLLLWVVYQVASGLWSTPFSVREFGLLAGRGIQVLVFVVATVFLVRRFPRAFERLLEVLVLAVAVTALVSMFEWYRHPGHPFPVSRLIPLGRISNAILAGGAYGVFCLLAFYQLTRARSTMLRAVFAAGFLVLLGAVLLTHSRTAILGLVGAFLAMSFCYGKKAVPIALGVMVAVFVIAQLWFPEVFDRFRMALHWRPLIWESVLARVAEAPWFGHGYLASTAVELETRVFIHAHSSYIGFLRDGGVVSVVLLLLLVLAIIRRVSGLRCGLARLLVPLLVFGFLFIAPDVDRLIVRPRELWLFFWWPLALYIAGIQAGRVNDATSDS